MENHEKLVQYYRGGDAVLEELIEWCGIFHTRVPRKNQVQSWLLDARKNWREVALENGGVDLEEKEKEEAEQTE